MANSVPPLPAGFTLDAQQSQIPPLPAGFTLDGGVPPAPAVPSYDMHAAALGGALPDFGKAEAALNFGTSMIAAPVAGLAGIGQGIKNFFSPGMQAGDRVEQVSRALTYEPRSTAGQEVTKAVQLPFAALAKGADIAGGKTAEVTGSPAAGAAVNTVVQSLPALLTRGRGKVGAPADAAATAENYVRNTVGVDWNGLSAATKSRITSIAQDASALEKLDPAAVKRQLELEALPVPITDATRGQLTRDPAQLRNEGNVSATETGRPIRDIYVQQNRTLLENLKTLKGDTGGAAETPEGVGLSVQGAARAKLDLQKSQVKDLYAKAEAAGELEAPVSPKPIIQVLVQSPDKTHLGWVQSWLNDTGAVTKTDGGTVTRKYTLKELEDLRQAAVARTADGGTDAYYAGKVINAIDQATAGAGGKAYAAARAARKAQATEFEEQGGVANLVDMKSRTDRAVALEDTWRQTVLGGSIQDLRNVKKTLLEGGNADTQAKGKQAWSDLQAQTLQHITDEATKGVQRFEDGTPNVTPAAMERAIKSVGQDKLTEIFGTDTTGKINQVLEATRTLKTEPPAGFKGSPTFANLITFLEKSIGRVPVVGDTATGLVRAGVKLREMGKAGREVRTAQETPLQSAEITSRNTLTKRRNRNALSRSSGAATETQRDNN